MKIKLKLKENKDYKRFYRNVRVPTNEEIKNLDLWYCYDDPTTYPKMQAYKLAEMRYDGKKCLVYYKKSRYDVESPLHNNNVFIVPKYMIPKDYELMET